MVDSILNIMLKDHAEIFSLLRQFEEGRSGKSDIVGLFNKFKNKQELHALVEERVIFGYSSFSREGNEMIKQVIDEHKIISDMLKSIQRNLSAGLLDVYASDIGQVLMEHVSFEEKKLYPTLNQELNDEVRLFITHQLKQQLVNPSKDTSL